MRGKCKYCGNKVFFIFNLCDFCMEEEEKQELKEQNKIYKQREKNSRKYWKFRKQDVSVAKEKKHG